MTASRQLTTKQKMVDVIQRMPDDATIDDAIDRLNLLKAVALGLRDVEEGRVHDHEEVFDELLNDGTNQVERPGKVRSPRTQAANRKRHARKGARLHPKIKGGSQ
jgi:predicted transcriptional regulator